MKLQSASTRILVGVLMAYVALVTVVGRFSGYDEAVCKGAGREWAETGRFAAPELTNYLNWDWAAIGPPPEAIFFQNMPLYALGFGLLTKLVGFGWRPCVFYDTALHAALAGLAYLVSRRLNALEGAEGPRASWASLAVALAVLSGGVADGRPDELAMCFGMGGLALLLNPPITAASALGSGVLFGLCAGTSTGAVTLLAPLALAQFLADPGPRMRRLRGVLVWGAAAALVLIATVAPILVPHPGAIEQYRTLARMHVGGAGYLERYLQGLRFSRDLVAGAAASLVVGLWLSLRHAEGPERARRVRLWLGPAVGVAFVLIRLPGKLNYFWLLTPWLYAAVAAELVRRAPRLAPWERVVLPGLLALGVLLGAEQTIKETLILATLPADQRAVENERRLRTIIPDGSRVLAADAWWLLAGRCRVYDVRFACPPDPSSVDYIVYTGNGSGTPGKPTSFDEHSFLRRNPGVLAEFEPVDDHLNRTPLTLFGVRLMNSSYGFGTLVLRRASPKGANSAIQEVLKVVSGQSPSAAP